MVDSHGTDTGGAVVMVQHKKCSSSLYGFNLVEILFVGWFCLFVLMYGSRTELAYSSMGLTKGQVYHYPQSRRADLEVLSEES